MPIHALAPTCLSVPGCGKPRLTYRGYCADHGPATLPLPPSRCLLPIRCHCDACSRRGWPSCPLPPVNVILDGIRARGRRHLAVVK